MDAMESIIKNLDWSPLFISLKTGIVATFISFFLGIYAARKVVPDAIPGPALGITTFQKIRMSDIPSVRPA